jgi:SsrA-binding protein
METLIHNKKAGFNYELGDKYDAGISLLGHEVKSLKNKRGNLSGSYVAIRGNEAFLIGLEIPAYQPNNLTNEYDPLRPRKLLLSKKEILKLSELDNERGLTLIPISVYNTGRNVKLSFAVGRGKKRSDKRQTIRQREDEREIHRTLKKQR